MKKKVLIGLVMFLIVITELFADFGYQFDMISLHPLHKEYFADRVRPDISLNYLNYFEGSPDKILQDSYVSSGEQEVKVWKFSGDFSSKDSMIEIKLGETIGIARNTFTFNHWLSPLSIDFSIQAELQSFYTGDFNDSYGYDGIYFYGVSFRVADFVSMRVGNHHYCTHYGDAIYKKASGIIPTVENWMGYKYIRMNDYVVGLSIEPNSWLRVYVEYNFPPKDISTLRPNMFAPNWLKRLKGQSVDPGYPDSYNARIISTGIEVAYPVFKTLGNTTIGYDLHLYEEGKIQYDHENGGSVSFDKNALWEMEHNIKISQNLSKTVSIELTYHNGRSPYNNFFFQHTEYFSISFRFNPDDTVTIFNYKVK